MAAVNWTQSTTFYTTKSTIIDSNVTGNNWLGFLDALGWMENDGSYTTNAGATYVGIYQVGAGVLTDTHFLTHIGNSLLGITTRQGVGEDPIAQELAGLMEFTGIPDIGGSFVSKYTATRSLVEQPARANWNLLLGSTFTINYTDATGVVGSEIITLTAAGITAAAHLVGQGTVANAIEEIFRSCFTETPADSGIYEKTSDSVIFDLAGNLADGNGIAFSTYIRLLQNYNVDTLISAVDRPAAPYTEFSSLFQNLIEFRKDDIINYLAAADSAHEVILTKSDSYKEIIRSVLKGLDLPDEYLDVLSDDGKIVLTGKITANEKNSDLSDLIVGLGDTNNNLSGRKGNDIVIGGKGDDVLNGDEGNDLLNGDDDNDTLKGGEGNDTLDGGSGNDTYIFEGNFGTDIIKDSDGSGSINITGMSTSFTSVQGSDIIFRDASKKFEAIKIINDGSTDLLITSLTDETTGNVLIKNWSPGNLGISLTVDTTAPSNTSAGTVNGDGSNNAITLDNLRDSNPNLDISTYSALYANGAGGNDIIMGMLQGNDTLLGGAGDDIISGGFTTTLSLDAPKNFQSGATLSGVDSIDGGAGKDFIFASAGGSMARGGADDDVLYARGPAYFQFNNLNEVEADFETGVTGHPSIPRSVILADVMPRMDFGIENTGQQFRIKTDYFKNFTNDFSEYNSTMEDVKFIGKRGGSGGGSYSAGQLTYGFSSSYMLTYDYSNIDELIPMDMDNPFAVSIAVASFQAGSGRTIEDYANTKGANLFGDTGHDFLIGGFFADYLSGGADNDTVTAGAGNDIIDGGDGNDELHGDEGKDIIIGGQGDDMLIGGDGNDLLVGGIGQDFFKGDGGDDILVGGVEDGAFGGGAGNNIFIIEDIIFEQGNLVSPNGPQNNNLHFVSSGHSAQLPVETASFLTIESSEGNNTLALVGVSSFDQISLSAQGDDFVLLAGNAALFIEDGLHGSVDQIALGLNSDEFKESVTTNKAVSIDDVVLAHLGTSINRTADTSGTKLVGGLLNDTLSAHAGGSILIGGKGNDSLIGNQGDDTYVIRAGDGADNITESGGTNIIKLAEGIAADQLTLRRNHGDLLLIISNEQTVVVNGMFNADTYEMVANKAIHQIQFSNGEVWDLTRLLQESIKGTAISGTPYGDVLVGYESNDTLTGGSGNDKLRGGRGDDRYNFAIGHGADQIDDANGSDAIVFAEGIVEAQVSLRKDSNNNLIVRINNLDSITVVGAFNAAGELTSNIVEAIHFNNANVWDLQRIQAELARDQTHLFNGTTSNDHLVGDNAKQIFNGGLGADQLNGGQSNDVYQYALGDGKDTVKDASGNDRLELLTGINESEVIVRRDGDNLVVTMKDGGTVTLLNAFSVKAPNVVDPSVLSLIDQLQSHWISQAEILIEQHFGLIGSGELTLRFESQLDGAEAAHVEATYSNAGGVATSLQLVIDLNDVNNISSGTSLGYYDRVIAHEFVHAIMARNMNPSQLPGWFTEGTAELIHGADERVKADADILGIQSNFNALFKKTPGSPSLSAGYSVSYIAVKLLDREIRANGGIGIREVFDQLKTGKTLDEALLSISAAHPGLASLWNSLSSFETHFLSVGFAQYPQLLTLDNADTGSIAGSDYGNAPLTAETVMSELVTGPSRNFTLVIPDQYVETSALNGALETITFASGVEWDLAQIQQELLRPTSGDDRIEAFEGNDTLAGSKGNDYLIGLAGNDVYRYDIGDGSDVIVDVAGIDQIEFGLGIIAENVRLTRELNNLVILLADGSTILVTGAFDNSGNLTSSSIESIRFVNGDVWDSAKIVEEINRVQVTYIIGTDASEALSGTNFEDAIVGGLGNDILSGAYGNDSYVYNLGDGSDVIVDVAGIDQIEFGSGILAANVKLMRGLNLPRFNGHFS